MSCYKRINGSDRSGNGPFDNYYGVAGRVPRAPLEVGRGPRPRPLTGRARRTFDFIRSEHPQ